MIWHIPLKTSARKMRDRKTSARKTAPRAQAWTRARLPARRIFAWATALLALAPPLSQAQTPSTVTYTVTFEGNWTTAAVPGGVHNSAHFTTLAYAVHNNTVTFWESGGTATSGVENLAELGITGGFINEINAAGAANAVSGTNPAGGGPTPRTPFTVEFTSARPLFTLMSMIGPSPDWFVGVSSLSMLDDQNQWLASHSVDLFAYDAGTEEGDGFSLNNSSTSPRGTISSLKGMTPFSDVRMARLTFELQGSMGTNVAPAFSGSANYSVQENAAAVGSVQAADTDASDSVTGYDIVTGSDGALFAINASGALRFRTAPNYEDPKDADSDNVYEVRVRATSGTGSRAMSAERALSVTVTDEDGEAPSAPSAPSVSASSASALQVSWTAPSNEGPDISDYDYRYRTQGATAWTEVTNTAISGLSITVSGLSAGTAYEVQVLAKNAEGSSGWSASGTGSTMASATNVAPAFSGSASFSVQENAAAVGSVQAADTDASDSVTGYAIATGTGGADSALFAINASGALTFKAAPNYEDPKDANKDNVYEVRVRATSGTGNRAMSAERAFSVTVTDEDGEAPSAPSAPSVSSNSTNALQVTWTAPANEGPAISDYDYRHRTRGAGAWTEVTNTAISGLSATIGGLSSGTSYEVQVLAKNAEGSSDWSDSGVASTEAAQTPSTATYSVTFTGNWTTASVPGGVVSNAHFTTLAYAVHNNSVTFWESGGMATSGVEGLAETGGTGEFLSEIRAAGAANAVAGTNFAGSGATGSASFPVEFTSDRPLFTLLSMIGPSPDWFVGVSGVSLLDDKDQWLSAKSIDLFPYDAGTEEGDGFSLSNPDTSPRGTITRLKGVHPFSDVRMARLAFARQGAVTLGQVTGVSVTEQPGKLVVSWTAAPNATGYKVQWKSGAENYDDSRQQVIRGGGVTTHTISNLDAGAEYTVRVIATRENEPDGPPSAEESGTPSSVVSAESEELPAKVALSGNYPNPFNPATTIRYELPESGDVRLAVYDALGHEVAMLVDRAQSAGSHAVRFEAIDLPSGVYLYRLQAGGKTMARTMMLVK